MKIISKRTIKEDFNSQQWIVLKIKVPFFIQNVETKPKLENLFHKSKLFTLILLANVAWVSPGYGMENEDEITAHINAVRNWAVAYDNHRKKGKGVFGHTTILTKGWADTLHQFKAVQESLFSKAQELVSQKNTCVVQKNQCINEKDTLTTSYTIATDNLRENLNAAQNAQATCNLEKQVLSNEHLEISIRHNQLTEELSGCRQQFNTQVVTLQEQTTILNNAQLSLTMCIDEKWEKTTALNTCDLEKRKCFENSALLSTQAENLAIELKASETKLAECLEREQTLNIQNAAKFHEQQAELKDYKNQLTWYEDRINIGSISLISGGFSSLIPEIIRDSVKYAAIHKGYTPHEADKYANYAATTATILKTGVIAYNAPLYALSGIALPYIAGKVVSGSLDYCYGAASPESITGGSTVSLLTSFAQDYLLGQNTLLDHSIAFGGYWAGSTLGLQTYGGVKKLASRFYGPAAVPAGAAAGGGAPGGNGGPGPNDGSDDDSGEDSSNGSSPTRKFQAFAQKFTSLQPLLAQLSIMNLDLDSAALEDMQLLMQNSVLLRKAIEREPLSQEIIVPQLNNFKATLENLKRLVEVAPTLEEPNVQILNLLKNLEHSAKNIIGISQI